MLPSRTTDFSEQCQIKRCVWGRGWRFLWWGMIEEEGEETFLFHVTLGSGGGEGPRPIPIDASQFGLVDHSSTDNDVLMLAAISVSRWSSFIRCKLIRFSASKSWDWKHVRLDLLLK